MDKKAFLTSVLNAEDPHQAVLDAGYDKWQVTDGWGYADMLDWVAATFGDFYRLAVQIGKYNQQVTNGGHMQYFDNGYASRKTDGAFQHHKETKLHDEMVELMRKFGYDVQPVFGVMTGFRAENEGCDDCDGQGSYTDYDEDEGEEYENECGACGGTGETKYLVGIGQDKLYYALYEEWLTKFEADIVSKATEELAALEN